MTVSIIALPTGATLEVGADLVDRVLDALDRADERLEPGDVLVVASKVVALAEGAVVAVDPDTDVHVARRDLARRHANRVVADHPRVLVVETRHGFVCANAGIDTSNVPIGQAVLLPPDPDASARRLRTQLRARTSTTVGVVVTDTFGRPWREGQVDVALGAAGVEVLRDERDGRDLWGRTLEVTVAAVADELAGAADLVRTKDAAVPFVLVRGLDVTGDAAAADLVRPAADDLFPAGGPTMADHVVARTRGKDQAPAVDAAGNDVGRLVALATEPGVEPEVVDVPTGTGPVQVRLDCAGPDALVAAGVTIGRLEVLAAARGWSTTVDPVADGIVTVWLDT